MHHVSHTCTTELWQLKMYAVCSIVASMVISRLPCWFSMRHLRPCSSVSTGGAAGALAPLPAGGLATATTPLRSARFFAFMSSVT